MFESEKDLPISSTIKCWKALCLYINAHHPSRSISFALFVLILWHCCSCKRRVNNVVRLSNWWILIQCQYATAWLSFLCRDWKQGKSYHQSVLLLLDTGLIDPNVTVHITEGDHRRSRKIDGDWEKLSLLWVLRAYLWKRVIFPSLNHRPSVPYALPHKPNGLHSSVQNSRINWIFRDEIIL